MRKNRFITLIATIAATLFFAVLLLGAGAEETSKIAYITFDDGPTLNTPQIIEALDKYNARATFFVLEERIVLYPDYIKQIINSGNAIGLHGVSHSLAIYRGDETPLSEMQKTNATLESLTGHKTTLVRVPYGSCKHLSEIQSDKLIENGYKIWDWNVDPRDSVGRIVPSNILRNLRNDILCCREEPVILFHDRKSTAKLLPLVLSYLSENGYEMLPISEKQKPMNRLDCPWAHK